MPCLSRRSRYRHKMMLLIKLCSLMTTICIKFLILFWVIKFAIKLINGMKLLVVWAFLGNIAHLTLFPAKKCYRREAVETGFSMSGNIHRPPVYHYRYQTVFDGTYRKIIVRFSNNIKLKIRIKEEGLLYKQLLLRSRNRNVLEV